MRITLSQVIVALTAVCAALSALSYHFYRSIETERVEEIIRQTANCAVRIPGEGLERRGDHMVGWVGVWVDGAHEVRVAGASDMSLTGEGVMVRATNGVIAVALKGGTYYKLIAKVDPAVPFAPEWTLPNGHQSPIPIWNLYALNRGFVKPIGTDLIPRAPTVPKPLSPALERAIQPAAK